MTRNCVIRRFEEFADSNPARYDWLAYYRERMPEPEDFQRALESRERKAKRAAQA